MRTLQQVIDELHAEAPKFWVLNLVVAFEHHTEVISSTDPDPVATLTEMVQRGGQAMGFMAFAKTITGHVELQSRIISEWNTDEDRVWVTRYLAAYCESVAEALCASGNAKTADIKPWQN